MQTPRVEQIKTAKILLGIALAQLLCLQILLSAYAFATVMRGAARPDAETAALHTR